MSSKLISVLVVSTLAVAPMGAAAIGNNEKGCLVGGAVGGVAGHALGGDNNKTLLGAAVGCGAGVLINKQRVKKNDAEKALKQQKVARKYGRDQRVPAPQVRPYS